MPHLEVLALPEPSAKNPTLIENVRDSRASDIDAAAACTHRLIG